MGEVGGVEVPWGFGQERLLEVVAVPGAGDHQGEGWREGEIMNPVLGILSLVDSVLFGTTWVSSNRSLIIATWR